MHNTRAAMEQALQALILAENYSDHPIYEKTMAEAIASLRAAIAAHPLPATLPESLNRDEALRYYSEYANMVANEVLVYQKRIRDLESALAARPLLESDINDTAAQAGAGKGE